jgi:hypothetical protein
MGGYEELLAIGAMEVPALRRTAVEFHVPLTSWLRGRRA